MSIHIIFSSLFETLIDMIHSALRKFNQMEKITLFIDSIAITIAVIMNARVQLHHTLTCHQFHY